MVHSARLRRREQDSFPPLESSFASSLVTRTALNSPHDAITQVVSLSSPQLGCVDESLQVCYFGVLLVEELLTTVRVDISFPDKRVILIIQNRPSFFQGLLLCRR